MDIVTHTVLGACIGEALAGKKIGKKAMLAGALVNNLPDLDIFTSLWMNQAGSLLAHRGFTHSILFAILATPLLGWLFHAITKKINFSAGEWMMLVGINLFSHLFIDAFTVYGTGWFEPFSHYRVTFNVLFVADPFYTIALLVACIILLLIRRTSVVRKKWAMAGIILSTTYLFYALYHKIKVNDVAEKSLAEAHIPFTNYMATPTPLNNFLWYIIARNDSGNNVGYYSVFDRSDKISFHFFPFNDSLLETVKNREDVKKLIRFSEGYYHAEKISDSLVFCDLRFGQTGGWDDGNAPFVFRYQLSEHADNTMVIQSGRLKASGSKSFNSMMKRIRGK